ncbi:curli production assembly/transport component CsgG domain protein [Leptospira ryugenii]|uniref:Curli production assembly/transport component CsgG domain protein n=2 Tax=Leptospira ryugenii TaxID=1917863 RepID=A0A2P2E190_9LEPT|nr:curli production assembly/transport component CsgG domain protein [Leptospira ryugenii]
MESAIQFPDPSKRDLNIQKIAVLTFDIEDAKWDGEFTDALSLQIAKHLPVVVIERDQLSKVVNEQSFSKTGIIDTQTAVRIGKILGVDALVFGRGSALRKTDSHGILHNNLIDTVSLKLVKIESGQVVVNARKKPGANWSTWKLTKYLLGFGFIWSREDILIETCEYDYVVESLVENIKSQL